LIDELWGDAPPASAANLVQGPVSHLRKVLGREPVSRVDGIDQSVGGLLAPSLAPNAGPAACTRRRPPPGRGRRGILRGVPTEASLLVAVPNLSEGRDLDKLERLQAAVAPARVLDVHTDPDHNRSVFTLAARQGDLAAGLAGLASAAVDEIDLRDHEGVHPHVGALDVMPVVWLDEERRGAACAEALTAAALVGADAAVPVFLYGDLATRPEHAERAWIRRGGPGELARRMEAGELVPDYGPRRAHPSAGATLATARPPLLAFNVDLDTDDVDLAKSIASELRESGGGPPGVRALGLYLEGRRRAQVSTNVHDHRAVPLREIVARVRARAPVAEAELIGLAPRAAFEGFPEDVPLRGFSPERHILEEALTAMEASP
jgi:glutamate formiminotransferase